MTGVDDLFARYSAELDTEMRSIVSSHAGALHDMAAYHLGWLDEKFRPAEARSGKHLRPTLCLLCCGATGSDYHRALPAAAALELVHNFSLVHDDVQDRSPVRRHRATVWSLWGDAQAINVGDALYALARIAILRLIERELPAGLVVTAAGQLEEAALALCNGQCLDLAFENRAVVSLPEYLEMVGGKTAALLACSAGLGALVGSGSEATARKYFEFGRNLGVAFQIQDDLLGIWGDPKVTGKPVADDVRSRKKSLPVVLALASIVGADGDRLRQLYGRRGFDESQVGEIVNILDRNAIRTKSEAMANEWCQRSLSALDAAEPLPPARHDLATVAAHLMGRAF